MSSRSRQEPQAAVPVLPRCCQGARRCGHPGPLLPTRGQLLNTHQATKASSSWKLYSKRGAASHQKLFPAVAVTRACALAETLPRGAMGGTEKPSRWSPKRPGLGCCLHSIPCSQEHGVTQHQTLHSLLRVLANASTIPARL